MLWLSISGAVTIWIAMVRGRFADFCGLRFRVTVSFGGRVLSLQPRGVGFSGPRFGSTSWDAGFSGVEVSGLLGFLRIEVGSQS